MSYNLVATGKTPALIIYLIDISGSMSESLDGMPKIEHVNQAIEKVLVRMVQRSTKGEVISPRYRLAMAAYSDNPIDILGGIQTIDDVAKKGRPKLSATSLTNTHSAFTWARDLLKQELPNLNGQPAPMVCHLTDGQFTGSDPTPIAQEIMQMSNDDGNVLIENIYVGPNLTHQPITDAESWPGLSDVSELNNQYAQQLFHISSPLPGSYADVIQEEGYKLNAGSRMLIPGTNKELIELAFAMSGATPTA
jgi:uncharacterized protein YegL